MYVVYTKKAVEEISVHWRTEDSSRYLKEETGSRSVGSKMKSPLELGKSWGSPISPTSVFSANQRAAACINQAPSEPHTISRVRNYKIQRLGNNLKRQKED